VHLVDDDVAQSAQDPRDLGAVDDEERLQGLRRDEQDPVGFTEHLGLA
jgi:hypothetical protein